MGCGVLVYIIPTLLLCIYLSQLSILLKKKVVLDDFSKCLSVAFGL